MATPDPAASRLAATQTVMNFASCFNRRNWSGVLALTMPSFRESLIGVSGDAETRERLEALHTRGLLPQLRIQSIEESGATGHRSASLAVTWEGWNGLHRDIWELQPAGGDWVLAGRIIDRPRVSGAAAGIEVIIGEDGPVAPRSRIVNPGTIILAFANRRPTSVTALVLAAPPNASADDMLSICHDPESRIEPAGWISIDPGSTVYMPMMELAAGRYAIVIGSDPCMESASPMPDRILFLDVSE